jgi:hypothetical protein
MQSPGQALKPTHVKGMFGELLLLWPERLHLSRAPHVFLMSA